MNAFPPPMPGQLASGTRPWFVDPYRRGLVNRPNTYTMTAVLGVKKEVPEYTPPNHREKAMPKYVIERDIPNVGSVTPEQVTAISQKSCSVLNQLGPQIQWVHSYVTQDKIYCVYIAPNEEMVREHARQGGFPANRVSEVKLVIDPTSAEA